MLDCPAGIEQGFANSVAGADEAIVVSTPEISAVRDADRVVGLLEQADLDEPPMLIINRIGTSNKGEPIVLNEKSPASKGYRNIARRLEGQTVPLMTMKESDESGFFGKIASWFQKK